MRRLSYLIFGILIFGIPVVMNAQFINGDFESSGGWTIETGGNPSPIATITETPAPQGSYCAKVENVLGNMGNPRWAYIRQKVFVPDSAQELHYWFKYWTDTWGAHVGIRVIANADSDTTYLESYSGGGSGGSIAWTEKQIDIAALAGDSMIVEIFVRDMSTTWAGNGDHGANFYADDFWFVIQETDPPDVQVTYPNGGETIMVGQNVDITWLASDPSGVESDSIYYSTDGGSSWIGVAYQSGNPQIYTWTVPNTPSANCLIQVVAFDHWGNRGFDVSDAVFSIIQDTEPPTVTVSTPNGGESWATGSVHYIAWSDTDNVAVVADSIYYSTDGGTSWIPVVYQTGNPQGYWWTIPNTPSTTCRVKVVVFDGAGLNAIDESDGDFEIYYEEAPEYRYAIVVSASTLADPDWGEVVNSLIARHSAQVFSYSSSIWETQADVSVYQPDYIGFVAPIPEPNPSFVQNHFWPYLRQLDSDPYPDAVGGIITGCDASDALRIVTGPSHLTIKTMLGGTSSCNVNYYPQGIGTNEATYGQYYVKYPDSVKAVTYNDGPQDRTEWLVNMINGDSLIFGDSVDIFVTSGHGSSNSWMMHYGSPNYEGYFRSNGFGHLYGDPYSGPDIDIISPNAKIYFGLGNCNIGQINNTGCMAPAWIHNGGAYLYTGYVITEGASSYQHGSTKAYFCLQDHYSWPTAFMLGNCCFVFDLANNTPGVSGPDLNGSGLYGDPAIDARIPEGPEYVCDTLLYTKELIVKEGVERDTITFRITLNKEGKPGYTSKWGFRSPICLFPFRIDPDSVEVLDTNADTEVIMDNFVLMYIWHQGQPSLPAGTQRWVTFTAKRLVGISEKEITLRPDQEAFLESYPNPFYKNTTVKFVLNGKTKVSLKVYDLSGRLVRTLADNVIDAGYSEIRWNGRNAQGRKLASGIYFYRLTTETVTLTNKVLLLR
ncbi:T9SS type A sorting domain-containing protein [candidate division WOR-3 bacterium]|nr:T9SS type A sorting domain-containing protein [candidate division WOR-3 bacterium]